MILASHIVGVLEMTDEQIKLLSKKKLYERIFATMNAHHTDEHLALVAERSRRAGFDIDQTLECVIEAAQREKYLSYVDIPDQLARPWSERRYQFPVRPHRPVHRPYTYSLRR